MDIRLAHSLFQALGGDRCAFGYSGSFPDELTARLIELGTVVLDEQGMGLAARGRLGYVMVEAYQNIIRHRVPPSADLKWNEERSLFLLRCHGAGQHVVTMNPVDKEQAEALRRMMAQLKGRDKAELKELFLAGLQRASRSNTRGAGLGLIEMSRRANGDPGWSLRPVDPTHELFALAIRLGKGMSSEQVLEDALTLHGPLAKQGVQLFHVGFRSPEVKEVLLRAIENEEGGDSLTGLVFQAAMDMMPDVAEGTIFMLGSDGRRSALIIGGIMPEEEMALLRDRVERGDQPTMPTALRELARTGADHLVFADVPVKGGRLALVKAVW